MRAVNKRFVHSCSRALPYDRRGNLMTAFTLAQIKRAVENGLAIVNDHFAKDPTPTDGSIRAAMIIAGVKPKRIVKAKEKPAYQQNNKRG
jgi:hypothetical protein